MKVFGGIHTRYKIASEFDYEVETIKEAYAMVREEALKCVSCGIWSCLKIWNFHTLNVTDFLVLYNNRTLLKKLGG